MVNDQGLRREERELCTGALVERRQEQPLESAPADKVRCWCCASLHFHLRVMVGNTPVTVTPASSRFRC